jgi:hypothetical protein
MFDADDTARLMLGDSQGGSPPFPRSGSGPAFTPGWGADNEGDCQARLRASCHGAGL